MIYVIGERNPDGAMSAFVKVGYTAGGSDPATSSSLKKRVNKLQVGNPRRLVVIAFEPGDRVREKQIHHMFGEDRVCRPIVTEWLHLRDGSDFAAWLNSVRRDPIEFGHAVGRGSRGGKPYVPRAKLCRCCGSTEHGTTKCSMYVEIRLERARAASQQARVVEQARRAEWRRTGLPPPVAGARQWTWRNVRRSTDRPLGRHDSEVIPSPRRDPKDGEKSGGACGRGVC